MTTLSIFAGSVYGNAQHAAEQVKENLDDQGYETALHTDPEVSDFSEAEAILVVTSTTGQGDVPPNLEWTISELRDEFPMLTDKPFAVAALGDSSYETFCGAGRQIHELLVELQGKPVADMLEIDAIETLEPEEDVIKWVNSIKDKLFA
ncbi:flavodoxin [Alteromonas halophila]|uniref:Flavodoxin n=1 Tax=Alteromonas halophila TaxID=516698 RepID=A0A918JBN4_9ALTE|nr:flavodoxin [Alteromonas halophila]GGW73141.1 flavodoxin [Alteromonas halophila]